MRVGVKRNVSIQALWGLMTVAKQPGEIAAGTLKPSHMYIQEKLKVCSHDAIAKMNLNPMKSIGCDK